MQVMVPSSHPKLVVAAVAMAVCLMALPALAAGQEKKKVITEAEVNAAQQAWCDGLVHIGAVDAQGGDVRIVRQVPVGVE